MGRRGADTAMQESCASEARGDDGRPVASAANEDVAGQMRLQPRRRRLRWDRGLHQSPPQLQPRRRAAHTKLYRLRRCCERRRRPPPAMSLAVATHELSERRGIEEAEAALIFYALA